MHTTKHWKCTACGACCEAMSPLFFGKLCPDYDIDTHLCKRYHTRPLYCRVPKGLDDEILSRFCNFYRSIRKLLQEGKLKLESDGKVKYELERNQNNRNNGNRI